MRMRACSRKLLRATDSGPVDQRFWNQVQRYDCDVCLGGGSQITMQRVNCDCWSLLQPTDRMRGGVLRLVMLGDRIRILATRSRQVLLSLDCFEHIPNGALFTFFTQLQSFFACLQRELRLINLTAQ